MSFTIHYETDEYRGSHAAEVAIAFAPKEGESVDELVERVSDWAKSVFHQTKGFKPTDRIVIRLTDER